MAVEAYDIDAVKSQLGEVLDDFIVDVRCVCVWHGFRGSKSLYRYYIYDCVTMPCACVVFVYVAAR